MKNDIKISIITICYNARKHIRDTIESVIKQDYINIEYIIIDGDSDDGTKEIIHEYSDKISCFISEKDNGISHAFNKGIDNSTGDVLCFLNAGDMFVSNDVLSGVANDWMDNNVDIIFYQTLMENDLVSPNPRFKDKAEKIWAKLELPHQATFVNRKLFMEMGSFNIELKIRMDYDFFARCLKKNKSYRYIKRVIVHYDDSGISSNKKNRVQFIREGIRVQHFYGMKVDVRDYLRIVKWTLYNLIK